MLTHTTHGTASLQMRIKKKSKWKRCREKNLVQLGYKKKMVKIDTEKEIDKKKK